MNGIAPSNLVAAGVAYLSGGVAAAAFGESSIVVNVLAGGGLGALLAQLIILARSRRGVHGRESEIVAAWSALFAAALLAVTLVVELL